MILQNTPKVIYTDTELKSFRSVLVHLTIQYLLAGIPIVPEVQSEHTNFGLIIADVNSIFWRSYKSPGLGDRTDHWPDNNCFRRFSAARSERIRGGRTAAFECRHVRINVQILLKGTSLVLNC